MSQGHRCTFFIRITQVQHRLRLQKHLAHEIIAGMMGGNDGMLDPKPIPLAVGGGSGRRSSLRQPFIVGGPSNDNDAHVSFKV